MGMTRLGIPTATERPATSRAVTADPGRRPFRRKTPVIIGLVIWLWAPEVRAHTFEAPAMVEASPDGRFGYTAVFTAAVPVEVAGSGFDGVANVAPAGFHGDGFCEAHVNAGEQSSVQVRGALIDRTQTGLVRAWFALCGERTVSTHTTILPPGQPRRFIISGHAPLREIRVGVLTAKGRMLRGTGVLVLDDGTGGAGQEGEIALDVRLKYRAKKERSIYRMRARERGRQRTKLAVKTVGRPETIRQVEIVYRPRRGSKVTLRDASAVQLITEP
jgi:hypothetical protein